MKHAALSRRARSGLVALALTTSLTGCDEMRKMTGMEPAASNTVTANSSAPAGAPSLSPPAGGAPAKPAGPANPALEAEVAQAVQDLQAELPMEVDSTTTITALRADGAEFVYEVAIRRAIPAAQIEALRQTLQASNQATLCGNPDSSGFIGRGGSMYYRYTDAGGARFESRIVSCP